MAALGTISRLGVIGDVHCEHDRLAAVLEFLSTRSSDALVCVGDVADGMGDIGKTCDLLQRFGVISVAGNHDRWLLTNELRNLPNALELAAVPTAARAYLASLPVTFSLTTSRGRLLLCHGLGWSDMSCVKPHHSGYELECNQDLQRLLAAGTYQFVVNGHTHQRMVRRFGNLVIVNAGTLKRDDAPCCGVIDFDEDRVEFFDLDPSGQVIPNATLFPLTPDDDADNK